MAFKLVEGLESLDPLRQNPLCLGYVLGIFPILIDTNEKVAYAVGADYTKGHRILGEEYWNEYPEDALVQHVIRASQLSGNFKWFISTMRTRLNGIKNPPEHIKFNIV